MIGTTISHYKILEKLGEGGMGVVYKAQDLNLDRLVALKFLPPHLADDPAEKTRFIHEAKAASALDHPNICAVHEIGETSEHQLFIVMPHYAGQTLKEKIKSGPITANEAIDIGFQVASGLAKAHDRQITHRDIKPGNIIITTDGVAKIVDFGLAKLSGRTKVTRTGSTMGTIAYMSPEQAQGNPVDHHTDIWSLGVTLYEMLTGELPFKSNYEQAVVYAILNESPPPVSATRTDVSPELAKVVQRCLEKDPSKRYQDVNEVLAELSKIKGAPLSLGLVWKLARQKLRVASVASLGGLVILLAIAYFLFDPFGGKGGASDRSLAVVHFENLPDPEDKDRTGAALANLLTTSLSQVKELDVTSREKLYHIQRYLTQSDEKTITPTLATQIAQQAGVRWMLMGTILRDKPNLVVTAQLIDVATGRVVSSYKPPEMTPDKLFALADSLTLAVMTALQLTPATVAETKPSWQLVTTSSQEAYRAYVEGREALWKYRPRDAVAPLKRAVEIDSSFAMAHLFLSTSLWLSGDPIGKQKHAQRAMQLRDRVTDRERFKIESFYAVQFERNWPKGIELLERYTQKYPNDPDPYMPLCALYADLNLYEKSEKARLQWLKLDPFDKVAWPSLAYFYAGLGRKNEALEAVDQYMKLAPGEFNPYDSKADIYLAFGDLDSARYWREKGAAFQPSIAIFLAFDALLRRDYPAAERYYHQSGWSAGLVTITIHRGRLLGAEQQIRKLERSRQLPWLICTSYERGNYPAMINYAQEQSDNLKKNAGDRIYGRDLLAWALLKNGNSKRAHELLEEVKKDISTMKDPFQQSQYEYALGLLGFEKENYDVALELIQAAFKVALPNRLGQFHYGVALFKAGRVAEAVDELQKATWTRPSSLRGPVRLVTEWYWVIGSVKAHYWLGVAFEQQGKKGEAIGEYEKFLDIWKDADFKSKEIEDAKAQVARLKRLVGK